MSDLSPEEGPTFRWVHLNIPEGTVEECDSEEYECEPCLQCQGYCNMVNLDSDEQCPASQDQFSTPVKRKLDNEATDPPKLKRQRAVYNLNNEWDLCRVKYTRRDRYGKTEIHYRSDATLPQATHVRRQQLDTLKSLYAYRSQLDKDIYDYETRINYLGCQKIREHQSIMTDKEAIDLLTVETLPMGSAFGGASEAVEAADTIQTSKEEYDEEEKENISPFELE